MPEPIEGKKGRDVLITSGGYDASAEMLWVPDGVDLEVERKKYRAWLHDPATRSKPFLTLVGWLKKNCGATDSDVEVCDAKVREARADAIAEYHEGMTTEREVDELIAAVRRHERARCRQAVDGALPHYPECASREVPPTGACNCSAARILRAIDALR